MYRAKKPFISLYGAFNAGDDVSHLPAKELASLLAHESIEQVEPEPRWAGELLKEANGHTAD